MFEDTKKTNKILKALMDASSGLFLNKNNRQGKISKTIEKSEFELERAEIIIDTLTKGLKEIYLSKTNLEIGDKIVDLIDWYNNHTKEDEPKIVKEKDLRSSHEKRLESI